MKILFISACEDFSDTSAAIRNRAIVKGLVKVSHVTSVEFLLSEKRESKKKVTAYNKICIKYRKNKSDNYRSHSNSNIIIKSMFLKKLKRVFRLFFPDILSIYCLFKGVGELYEFTEKNEFDYIILNSDPKGIHFLLFNFRFKRFLDSNPGSKVVTVWGDPWYLDIHTRKSWLVKVIERAVLRRSDFIAYNTLGTLKAQKAFYADFRERMIFLPRTIDLKSSQDESQARSEESINILYAGDYRSVSRNILPLYESFSSLHDLSLTICGNSDFQIFSHKNIKVLGRQSKQYVDELIGEAGLLVVLLNLHGTQLPGKLYDYAITNKPILMLYEDISQTYQVPFPTRFIFLKNETSVIFDFFENFKNKQFSVDVSLNKEMEGYMTSAVVKKFFLDMGEEGFRG